MRRKFIAKNKKNFSFFTKIFLFIILGVFVLSKILSFKLFENNTNFIMHIMENSNHLIETELSYNDKINDFTMLLMDSDVKNPVTIFQNKYIYEEKNVDYQFDGFFKNISKKINNINITNMVAQTKLPKVYIYNTHQTEEYVNDNFYNLTPTVYTAAELLKDKLEQKGITTIVENGNVT